MYQLYIIPGTCSAGIHALLLRFNLPHEIIRRDETEDYQALVPTNQVPALQTNSLLLTEGGAIALHLMNEQGEQHITNNPEFLRWLMFNYATLHTAYSKLFSASRLMAESSVKTDLMHALAQRVTELWDIVDQHLHNRTFMFAEQATVIDYLLATYLRWGNAFPELSMPVGPSVLACVERVLALPEYQKMLAAEEVDYQFPQNCLPN